MKLSHGRLLALVSDQAVSNNGIHACPCSSEEWISMAEEIIELRADAGRAAHELDAAVIAYVSKRHPDLFREPSPGVDYIIGVDPESR